MIYLPKHFEENDRERALKLIKDYPFATLISVHDGAPQINHLPIILEETGSTKLLGHMSRRNPQSQLLTDGGPITAIFHGPHTYITPKWYAENDVPTWNYATVHITGRIRWVDSFKPLIGLLQKMTKAFESAEKDPWRFFLPDDLKSESELTSAIIGFEIEIESIEAKFKLSQNRSVQDREGVIQGLGTRLDEMSRKVQTMMRGSE